MERWQSLVEERIQNAMNEGHFDNLPGKGKPLNWEQNGLNDPAKDLANGLLKNNGYTPEWIERDRRIREEIAEAREKLRTAWHFYQPDSEETPGWQAAVQRFTDTLHKLNKKIDDYNLIVPILSKQRLRLRLAEELARLKSEAT